MSSLYPRAGNYASLKMLLTPPTDPYYASVMETNPTSSARKALAAAKAVPESDSYARELATAYMRILLAFRTRAGVRLTADEVQALVLLDSAINLAAENIEAEFVGDSE